MHRRGRKTGQIKICHMCLPTPVLSGSGDEGQKSGRIFSLSNRSPGNVIKFWLQFTAYDSQVEGACQAFFEAAAVRGKGTGNKIRACNRFGLGIY